MAESKIEAARRTGSLTNVLDAMREHAAAEAPAPASGRESFNEVDGAIRLAAHFAETGTKKGAERRDAMRGVRPGATVTNKGVAKTLLSRAEKIERVKAWASAMTEQARTEYMIGQKYSELSENAQDIIAEAFGEIEEATYESSIGIANLDFDAEPVDIDALPEDDTETAGESFGVQEGEDVESFDDYDALFEANS